MPISLIIKDLFWWLIKENRLVNLTYLRMGKHLFKKIPATKINSDSPLTSKPDYTNAQPQCKLFVKGYSSGTTNKPLTVYRSIKSILLEEYILKTTLKEFHLPLRPRIAVLRGDHISDSDNKDKFWMKLPFTGRLILSSYHLGPNTAKQYLQKLREYKPDVIMAYPSSIYLLAQMADDLDWRVDWPIRCIFTSSETFTKAKRKLVRKVFGTVCDHYGQAERVAILQTCRADNYHVKENYSVVEFVEDEHGLKLVGSNVHNKAMPMLRYDTGDYVKGHSSKGKCACGNPSAYVEEILGRDDDYVILPDGRQIGRLDVAFKGIDGLVEAQLDQTLPTKMVIRYVAYEDTDHDVLKKDLEHNLRERLGSALEFEFVAMEKLPRTERGKFKSVVRSAEIA